MSDSRILESLVEQAALAWIESLGYKVYHGSDLAPDEPAAERDAYDQVVLTRRLYEALARLNPKLPSDALDDAFRKLTRLGFPSLVLNNRAVHRMLLDGVAVEFQRADGSVAGAQARVIDFDDPANNNWLAVNQFTVVENKHNRRPDIVIFLNGLPVVVIELKNAVDENATLWTAFNQLQTYKEQIPSLFVYNAALLISDGLQARAGTLTANREWFMPWRTIEGEELAPASTPELQVVLSGMLEKRRLLDLIRYFIVFEDPGNGALVKKMAGYHQFHAVNTALRETLRAIQIQKRDRQLAESPGLYETGRRQPGEAGDRRIGVVWHTQGSGKSLTMAFYAGRVILHPQMANPTLVVITDRNDLDDQLFATFARCRDLLRQPPVQAIDRADLRAQLQTAGGGVVFTTIQKFFPEVRGDNFPQLSDRRNIVVIADEAHRSQYDFVDGFAAHMRDALPNASFIGFTGTPIELSDANTRAVFGDYISVYDIRRAVQDGATVPIYYESRLAMLALDERETPHLDEAFDEVTEGQEQEQRERLKTKWAQLEALVGAKKRIELVARDLVGHCERRQEVLDGKVMIVCMSRRICVDLYNALVALRPQWHDTDDAKGEIKIVMTGSAGDPLDWQPHIRNKQRREELADRFRDPGDPFKIVIVRDMWLTGFDAPSLHTMYVDKPMRGHGLMQAIARVNRVFKDKPGGLIVDYLGIAYELQKALATYTQSGGTGAAAIDQEEAVALLKTKYEICCGLFHGFDWSLWTTGKPTERMALLGRASDFILRQPDGKNRLMQNVTDLSKAFTLAVPHVYTLGIRGDVGFFQDVRRILAKPVFGEQTSPDEMDHAIRQLVSRAVSAGEMIDIFAAAGLPKPNIAVLSDEFLAEVRELPQRNLAVELLQKLLNHEIQQRSRSNVVQARQFSKLLEEALRRYRNRAVETAQVIEELINLATEMREANRRGEKLGLSEDELAFYDALETNDSAVKVLGEPLLKQIAQELVEAVRRNVSIDWTVRESVRAKMRVLVKRILRRHGYPPDKQEKAAETVLEQAEVLSAGWAG